MTNDLENAVRLLEQKGYSCVLCKDETVYTSRQRGVTPLCHWIDSGMDLTDFCAADKIIGKAAALLFVRMGVREVYAPVMSETAVSVLSRFGIKAGYRELTSYIVNREGTGSCPMEQAVADIEEPDKALEAVRKTMKALAQQKNARHIMEQEAEQ